LSSAKCGQYAVKKMAPRRNTRFTLINTNFTQELNMILVLESFNTNIGLYDNCAYRSSKALDVLYEDIPLIYKLTVSIPRPGVLCCHLPIEVEAQALVYMAYFGGKRFTINKTSYPNIPVEFYQF